MKTIQAWWQQQGLHTAWLSLIGASVVVAVYAVLGWLSSSDVKERATVVAVRLTPAVREASSHGSHTGGVSGQGPTRADAAVQRVRERYLWTPPPREAFRSAQGVLGDRVLYAGGQSFGVGDDAMGAKVLSIRSSSVEFEYRGEKVTVDVFASSGGGGGWSGGGGGGEGGGDRRSLRGRGGGGEGGVGGERGRRRSRAVSEKSSAELEVLSQSPAETNPQQ